MKKLILLGVLVSLAGCTKESKMIEENKIELNFDYAMCDSMRINIVEIYEENDYYFISNGINEYLFPVNHCYLQRSVKND